MNTIKGWVLRHEMLLLRCLAGTAILLVIGGAYLVDKQARNQAAERAARIVPNPGDSSTWNISPSASSTVIDTPRTDPVYPMTRENLLAGNIKISNVPREDGVYVTNVIFKDRKASSCDASDASCEGFEPGMFVIRDVAYEVRQTYVGNDDHELVATSTDFGVVLVERHYGTTSDMALMYIGPEQYAADPQSYQVFDVQSVSPTISQIAKIQKVSLLHEDTISGQFSEADIQLDSGTRSFALASKEVKDGMIANVLPMLNGKVVRTFPFGFYEPVITENGTTSTYRPLGVFQYTFAPTGTVLGTIYMRGQFDGGYSAQFNGQMARVYFKDACEMPYTYSDFRNFAYVASSSLKVDVSIPQSTSYNITTSYYGYDPNEWGKVLEVRDVTNERAQILAGTAFNGLPTEQLTLAGIPVRHTLPRVGARPCDESFGEAYQWVKAGNIYSVTVTRDRAAGIATDADTAKIKAAVTDVIMGLTYEPLPTH